MRTRSPRVNVEKGTETSESTICKRPSFAVKRNSGMQVPAPVRVVRTGSIQITVPSVRRAV
jgi:hypothetical protein